MTNPDHERVTEARRAAAQEVMNAYQELCDAADLYEPED